MFGIDGHAVEGSLCLAQFGDVVVGIGFQGLVDVALCQMAAQAGDCIVIFITNYWNYLDNAFAVKAFRYWKKPIDADRLRNGIDSALNELKQNRQIVTLKTRSGEIEIPAKNIVYACVLNKIVRVVSLKGEISVKDTYNSVSGRLKMNICRTR